MTSLNTSLNLPRKGAFIRQNSANIELKQFERKVPHLLLKRSLFPRFLEISAGNNSLLLAMGLRYIEANFCCLDDIENQVNNPKLTLSFLEGVSRELSYLNDDSTLKVLLVGALGKLKEAILYCETERDKIETLYYIVNLYPVLEMAIVAFARGLACLHLSQHREMYKYSLMGNQLKLLRNYAVNLRNMPLNLVADALQMSVTVHYESSRQCFGNMNNKIGALIKDSMACGKGCHLQEIVSQGQVFKVPTNNAKAPFERFFLERQSPLRRILSSNSNNPEASDRQCTDRSKGARNCHNCGKIKTQRFCQCRKTPRKSQEKKIQNIVVPSAKVLKSQAVKLFRCHKCQRSTEQTISSSYCLECIDRYRLKKCKQCQQFFEMTCKKCWIRANSSLCASIKLN